MRVLPLPNLLFPADDAPVVAGVSGEVYPFDSIILTVGLGSPSTGEEVDMARKMAGSVNNVETTIAEEVER